MRRSGLVCFCSAVVLLLAAATVAAPSWALTSDWTGAGAAIPGRSVKFDSTQAITINDYSTAGPYPSTVTVPASLNEPITHIYVRVKISHGYPQDIDMMLVGPHGQQVMLMSDAGGTSPVNGVNITFGDEASGPVPAPPLDNRLYQPTDNEPGDAFPAPAPGGTTNTSFSVFTGTLSAGDWSLYVLDDWAGDSGVVSDWTLTLGVVQPDPAAISVSGLSRVQDLNVTLTGLSHTYPDDLDVLLVGPQGQQATLLSDSGGGTDLVDATLTFDDQASALPPDGSGLTSGTWRPSNFDQVNDFYRAPAPPATGASTLSAFNGTDPNGTWRLFVMDDNVNDFGNLGSWTLTFNTDQAAPSGTITIDNGAAATSGRAVTLALSAADPAPDPSGVSQMRFSNDGAAWSAWQPYAATTAWTLASGADGIRTVYAQFIDNGGNVSATVSDTIQLATSGAPPTPPTPPDTASPSWTRLVPAKKAKKVSRSVTIKIFVSEALDARTVSGKTVFLKRKGSSAKVKAKVSYDKAKKLIVLNPKDPLAKHKTYRVTVTPKVTDGAGDAFDGNTSRTGTQNLRWIFVTR